MEIYLNNEHKVDYKGITENTSVQDLINAVIEYANTREKQCANCKATCCKQGPYWQINVDNVCVKKNAGFKEDNIERFINNKLVTNQNHMYILKKIKSCRFLNGFNKCSIYDKKPICCTLYLCDKLSEEYNLLRNLTGYSFEAALVYEELIKMELKAGISMESINKYFEKELQNPAYGAKDYDIPLIKVLNWDKICINKNEQELFDRLIK